MTSQAACFADIARVESVDKLTDDRGNLFEPVPDALLETGRALHVHLVECKPGGTRANHVHYDQTEVLCLLAGTFRVIVEDTESGARAEQVVTEENPLRITMRPGVAHAFTNIGQGNGYILGYSDRSFDPTDIHPYQLCE